MVFLIPCWFFLSVDGSCELIYGHKGVFIDYMAGASVLDALDVAVIVDP
jgi:hypothetical protein